METQTLWSAGQIERHIGLNKVQLRRYALLCGYTPVGSGKPRSYLHNDVEAFATIHAVQTAVTSEAGAGGLSAENQQRLLADLVEHTVVSIILGPATLTVTRLKLDPPT